MPKKIIYALKETVGTADRTIHDVTKKAESLLNPVRESAVKRFPVSFMLLTTFGAATTFFGFERIISQSTYLEERPWLILGLGIFVLILTGTLYKKLR